MSTKSFELRSVVVGSAQENCYVLHDAASRECIVFDPGAEIEKILPLIGQSKVAMILLTHAHPDHIGAVNELRERTGAAVLVNPAEIPMLGDVKHDLAVYDGEVITWETRRIRAVQTPGHTAGMTTFIIGDIAIVGDTLFEGGPGRTESAADFQTTLETLRFTVLKWPDALVCYPGHGPSFLLGDILDRIRAFVEQEHPTDFFGDAEW